MKATNCTRCSRPLTDTERFYYVSTCESCEGYYMKMLEHEGKIKPRIALRDGRYVVVNPEECDAFLLDRASQWLRDYCYITLELEGLV